LELSVQEDGKMQKQEEGKVGSEASMELVDGHQTLDVSLVADVHELHPLTGPGDGTHQEP
jgi:hypothetical protein